MHAVLCPVRNPQSAIRSPQSAILIDRCCHDNKRVTNYSEITKSKFRTSILSFVAEQNKEKF